MALYRSPDYRINRIFGSGAEVQNRLPRQQLSISKLGGHLRIWIGTLLALNDLHYSRMLPIKFRDHWPFGSGEEAKNRF